MTTDRPPGATLVTGGTGAIGSAVCRLLADSGHDIAFTYRSNGQARDELVEVIAKAGRQVLDRSLDLADPGQASRLVSDVVHRFGAIRSVIHAAGPHVPQRYISQVDPESFAHHLDYEVKSFFNVVQPALTPLRASRGCIVAVTTVAGRRFPARDGLSSGPKAGIEALVRAIAAEEGKYGVRANCVGPGIFEDGMAAALHANGDLTESTRRRVLRSIPLRRFGVAQDAAELICFLASDKASYISGQVIDVDGGYSL
jgi:NAD(P)-dependent dehydrogenase (short-subunit alcohol dehydrogenase family)